MSSYDIIIKDGTVVDGTGNPWFRADVGISDGKIKKIEMLEGEVADLVINASGLIICPGFIDIHTHTYPLKTPRCESAVMQGVTLNLTGNCGFSSAPSTDLWKKISSTAVSEFPSDWTTFKEWIDKVEKQGISINMASLVGHNTVRRSILGYESMAPTESELEGMKKLIAEAMEDGVFGMSTGLGYYPGSVASTKEVIELTKIVNKYGGIYATHHRYCSYDEFIMAIKENIEIGEKSDCPVLISHIAGGGLLSETGHAVEQYLKLIDDSRARGVNVMFDNPPYTLGGGGLIGVLPDWAFEGGPKKILERLKDPKMRERARAYRVGDPIGAAIGVRHIALEGNWDHIWIADSKSHPEFNWKNMAEIAQIWGKDPWETAFDLLIEEGKVTGNPTISCRNGLYNEPELRRIVKHPAFIFETDSSATTPYGDLANENVHTRAYGSYPLIMRKWVRGETRPELIRDEGVKLLTLEEAIKKSTSIAAQMIKLWDRGLIRPGMWADIVIFDLEKITDIGTYQNPHQYPKGIHYVLVNGVVVVEEGNHSGALPGKFLRGPGYKPK